MFKAQFNRWAQGLRRSIRLRGMAVNWAGIVVTGVALCAITAPLAMAAMPSSEPVKVKLNVLFILDSSGSMWARLDGEPKVLSARRVLADTISGLPPDANLGLLTYGHRREGDCSDIEMIAPIGQKSAKEIEDIANGLKPKGMTPLSEALKMGAESFKGIQSAKMMVLITDGGEECGGDPCETARKLAASGLIIRVNVVGLIISPKEREQLQCIAKEGGGQYFDVTDKVSLHQAVDAIQQDVVTYTSPPKRAPVVVEPEEDDSVNLLLPSEGGQIVSSPNASWSIIISGKDGASVSARSGQDAVFAFRDKKAAQFSKFAIAIPASMPQNVKQFELLVSKESPRGPYISIGKFTTDNNLAKTQYQEFSFPQTTGKYLKFRVISNYGYQAQGWGDTQIFQIKLMGTIK